MFCDGLGGGTGEGAVQEEIGFIERGERAPAVDVVEEVGCRGCAGLAY